MSVILNFRGLCCVGSIFYYYFFSSGVIKCWGDLKRSLHWGGKTAITALMQWSRRPSSPSFGPVTVYIKSEIMCCVGAKVMRPLGSNQGWHSPTYSYSNSTASTFTRCHTRVAGEQREQKQQCEEKRDRHRAEELCKHVGAAALQWKIRLKNKTKTMHWQSSPIHSVMQHSRSWGGFARSGSHKCIKVVVWVEVMEGRETFLR